MDELELVTYCGLYCKLCAERTRIPARAQALREAMRLEGYDSWGRDIPGFDAFWAFLGNLTHREQCCPGCRQGGGYPPCAIRQCARERQVRLCPECADYPCERIREFARVYPTLMADGERLRAVGLAQWLAEQDERAAAGFCYADVRYRA